MIRLLAAPFLALAFALPTLAAPLDEQQTASELQGVVKELNALDRWLDEASKRQANLQAELKSQDVSVAQISRQVRNTDASLAETAVEIDQLETERNDLSVVRAMQAQRIAQHVNAAYRLQGQDVVKALLNQESPHDFERILRYHRYFSDARMDVLRGYQETLVAIEANHTELQAQQVQLSTTKQQLSARRDELQARRSERATLIDTLAKEMTSKSARAAALRADQARLEALVKELQRRKRNKKH